METNNHKTYARIKQRKVLASYIITPCTSELKAQWFYMSKIIYLYLFIYREIEEGTKKETNIQRPLGSKRCMHRYPTPQQALLVPCGPRHTH